MQSALSRASLGILQPPAPQRLNRDARHVRLDVEDGRLIKHVDAVNVQRGPFAAQQLDNRERDRVRPARGAGGEDSVRYSFSRRSAEKVVAVRTIKYPEYKEVREALDVFQPLLKLRQDLDRPVGLMLGPRPLRHLRSIFERSPRKSDGAWSEENVVHRGGTVERFHAETRSCGGKTLAMS